MTKDEIAQPVISDKAEELLRAAQKSGVIVYLTTSSGTTIGHKTSREPREIAEYVEAVEELQTIGFLEKKSKITYQFRAVAFRWLDANEKK